MSIFEREIGRRKFLIGGARVGAALGIGLKLGVETEPDLSEFASELSQYKIATVARNAFVGHKTFDYMRRGRPTFYDLDMPKEWDLIIKHESNGFEIFDRRFGTDGGLFGFRRPYNLSEAIDEAGQEGLMLDFTGFEQGQKELINYELDLIGDMRGFDDVFAVTGDLSIASILRRKRIETLISCGSIEKLRRLIPDDRAQNLSLDTGLLLNKDGSVNFEMLSILKANKKIMLVNVDDPKLLLSVLKACEFDKDNDGFFFSERGVVSVDLQNPSLIALFAKDNVRNPFRSDFNPVVNV